MDARPGGIVSYFGSEKGGAIVSRPHQWHVAQSCEKRRSDQTRPAGPGPREPGGRWAAGRHRECLVGHRTRLIDDLRRGRHDLWPELDIHAGADPRPVGKSASRSALRVPSRTLGLPRSPPTPHQILAERGCSLPTSRSSSASAGLPPTRSSHESPDRDRSPPV